MNSSELEQENNDAPEDARAAASSQASTAECATPEMALTSDQPRTSGIAELLAEFGVTGEPPEQMEEALCDVCIPDHSAFLFCEDCQNNLCFGCAFTHNEQQIWPQSRHRTTYPKLGIKNTARMQAHVVRDALSELRRQMDRLQRESQTVENDVKYHCKDGLSMMARELDSFLRIFRSSVTDARQAMEEERQYLEERQAPLFRILGWKEGHDQAVPGILSFRAEDAFLEDRELKRLKLIRDEAFFEYRKDENCWDLLMRSIQSFLGTVVYRPQTDHWSPVKARMVRRPTHSSTSQRLDFSGAGSQQAGSSGQQTSDSSSTSASRSASPENNSTLEECQRELAETFVAALAGTTQVPAAATAATTQGVDSTAGTLFATSDWHAKMRTDVTALQEQQAILVQQVEALRTSYQRINFILAHLQMSNAGVHQTVSRLVLENQAGSVETTSLKEQLAKVAQDQVKATADIALVQDTMRQAESQVKALDTRLQRMKQSQVSQIKWVKDDKVKLQQTLVEVQQGLASSQGQLVALQQILVQRNIRRAEESATPQRTPPAAANPPAILLELWALLTSPSVKWLLIALMVGLVVSVFTKYADSFKF